MIHWIEAQWLFRKNCRKMNYTYIYMLSLCEYIELKLNGYSKIFAWKALYLINLCIELKLNGEWKISYITK